MTEQLSARTHIHTRTQRHIIFKLCVLCPFNCCRSRATVRTGHGTTDWFQIGKGVCQGCILSPCLFHLYAEHIMRNARLDEAQAGIKIAGRNINNQICRWHYSYGRKWRGTEESLDESERGEWKSWLKIQHPKNEDHGTHSPITSWRIDGETMETCQTWFYWAPKSLQLVTAAMKLQDACSWKKGYDKPREHIKNQSHHFANKGPSSQSYGFSSGHVWIVIVRP